MRTDPPAARDLRAVKGAGGVLKRSREGLRGSGEVEGEGGLGVDGAGQIHRRGSHSAQGRGSRRDLGPDRRGITTRRRARGERDAHRPGYPDGGRPADGHVGDGRVDVLPRRAAAVGNPRGQLALIEEGDHSGLEPQDVLGRAHLVVSRGGAVHRASLGRSGRSTVTAESSRK